MKIVTEAMLQMRDDLLTWHWLCRRPRRASFHAGEKQKDNDLPKATSFRNVRPLLPAQDHWPKCPLTQPGTWNCCGPSLLFGTLTSAPSGPAFARDHLRVGYGRANQHFQQGPLCWVAPHGMRTTVLEGKRRRKA